MHEDSDQPEATIKELDVVKILRSTGRAVAGETGAVVYRWGTGQAYEVEFSGGRVETVMAKDLEKMR